MADFNLLASLQDNNALVLGGVGFLLAIASLIYARSQARGTHAQLKSAREQAVEALRAAGLVAESARTQATEALRAAELVAASGRQQAVEMLRAAELVAESGRQQATEALRAAGLVAEGAKQQAVEALRAAGLVAENARIQAVEALDAAELVAASAKEQALEALRAAGLVAENARIQAVEALDAAELVAASAKEQAAEALRAAGLVAEGSREQAVEALRAAGLVAESARKQADQALRAAELLANSAVSARVREMRARNFRVNPNLPSGIQLIIQQVGGPEAYAVMLDSMDVAQEIYVLRARGMVSDDHWRMWMNDQMVLIAQSPSFQDVFQRAADQGVLVPEFVQAFAPVFHGQRIVDPGTPRAKSLAAALADGPLDDAQRVPQGEGDRVGQQRAGSVEDDVAQRVAPALVAERDALA